MNEIKNIKFETNIGKSIESMYILKNIFSFLSAEKKLKIIIYNKHLQKKLDINIEDYKKIKGIYKEGERNGKGKEYYISTNTILFEGEYLNGKRNGKGKEYHFFNSNLKYEGEYLNGEKNGKGKEYNYDGKLKYEGEFLNSKINGKGKEYYDDGSLKYEGEYLNEKRWNGKGYNKEGRIDFEIKEGNG